MTKMPDKIYVGRGRNDKIIAFEAKHSDETEYTRTDLIPQPVTDEARAKALEWVNYALSELNKGKGAMVILSNSHIGGLNTIKSALSQPSIPVQDELVALKAKNADLRRAVVDLADLAVANPYGNNDYELTHHSLLEVVREHAATIAKAKAVQG